MGGQKVRTGPFHQRPPATALWGPCWRWLERTAPHNSPPGWSWSAQVSAWPSSFWFLLRAQSDGQDEKLGIDFKSFKLHLWRLHSDGREIRRSGRKGSPMRSSEYFSFQDRFTLIYKYLPGPAEDKELNKYQRERKRNGSSVFLELRLQSCRGKYFIHENVWDQKIYPNFLHRVHFPMRNDF